MKTSELVTLGKVFIFHYLFYVLTINGLKQNNYLELTNAFIQRNITAFFILKSTTSLQAITLLLS